MPSPIYHFAGAPSEPHLASVLEDLIPDPRRFTRLRVDMRNIGDMNRQLLVDDTARFPHARFRMPVGDMHALNNDARLRGQNSEHLTRSALIAPADDDDVVAFF